MSSHTRRRRASHLSRPSLAIKSADDDARTDYDTRKVPEHPSEEDASHLAEVTLDELGGRSDALGG
jgi:hypothetical protein